MIIEGCLQKIRTVLQEGKAPLEAVAQRLVEKEILEDRELLELLEAFGFPIRTSARKNLLEHTRQKPMVKQITTTSE